MEHIVNTAVIDRFCFNFTIPFIYSFYFIICISLPIFHLLFTTTDRIVLLTRFLHSPWYRRDASGLLLASLTEERKEDTLLSLRGTKAKDDSICDTVRAGSRSTTLRPRTEDHKSETLLRCNTTTLKKKL